MLLRNLPISEKLMRVILLTSAAVLIFTTSAFFAYEFFTFRHSTVNELSTLGNIIADNSTASLAFRDSDDATEILQSLKAQPHIIEASLFDSDGNLFAQYLTENAGATIPLKKLSSADTIGDFHFEGSYITGLQPVILDGVQLGTLYIKSDTGAMFERLKLYSTIALGVVIATLVIAYFLSRRLQQLVSKPILALASTAKTISEKKDYSARAKKLGDDEIGALTDAFNQMLAEIQTQNRQIQSFNQNLENLVEKRTHDLEVANKELEAFSYSVSHDLRAPIRSINGYSRILLEDYGDKIDDEGREAVESIRRNGERMGQLIDDLLAFSRLGKQNVTKVPLDMYAIASNAVEEQKGFFKEAEIRIDNLASARGDSSMLKQVMHNLISNALKYSMKKEKPVIEIGCYPERHSMVYYVRDNGAGFDMQYYDKLFGVFQRLHSSNDFEGTGVGLALVHRIITRHGGRIWAEGKENVGATFYFSLPFE